MMIRSLGTTPPEYTEGYVHTRWSDHRDRIERTIRLAKALRPVTAADLAAGDGAVLDALDCPKQYGDIVPHPGWVAGPIEETVRQVTPVDLFISTETLEHLVDPAQHLQDIRKVADRLLLSTPVHHEYDTDDANPEHLWMWDRDGLESLLVAAGWQVAAYMEVDYRSIGGYLTSLWVLT